MTIDSSYFNEIYTNDGEVTYRFLHEVIDDAYILVYEIDSAGEFTLIPESAYTILLNVYRDPIAYGGTITLDTPLTGAGISIQRKTAIDNTQDFSFGDDSFNTRAYEFALDKLTLILQEINGTICDCSTSSGNPTGPANVAISCLFQSEQAWNGYDDGYGRVFSNTDSSVIMLNHLGATKLMVSEDFGASWVEKDMYGIDANEDKIVSLSYDATNDRWYVGHTRESARDMFVSYSDDNFDSFTPRAIFDIQSYGHSVFWDNDSGALYVPRGTPDLEAFRYNNPVNDWGDADIVDFSGLPAVNTNSWRMVPLNAAKFIMFHSGNNGQGQGADSYSIFDKAMDNTGDTNFNALLNQGLDHRSWATRGQGVVLDLKDWDNGVARFYTITDGLPTGGVEPPTISVPSSFAAIASSPALAYSGANSTIGGAPGMYVVLMIDDADRESGEIWYCIGDDFDVWHGPFSFSLAECGPYIAANNQVYHLRDDKWGFVYIQRPASTNFTTFVEIDLAASPPINGPLIVQSLLNFADMPNGTTITDTGAAGLSWSAQGNAVISGGELTGLDGSAVILSQPPTSFRDLFDGTPGDKWTIEGRNRTDVIVPPEQHHFAWRTKADSIYGLLLHQSGADMTKLKILVGDGSQWVVDEFSTTSLVAATEFEWALTRNVNDYYYHINGIYQGTFAATGTPDFGDDLTLGGSDDLINGFMGEMIRFRMTTTNDPNSLLYGEENYTPEGGNSYGPLT